MEGTPTQFETIGNRIGFRVVEESDAGLRLFWQGPRFPAFLCLGIALLLLFVSVPIVQAIYLSGLASRAAALWYFPVMNVVLLGIAFYLLAQQRRITVDRAAREVVLYKRNFFGTISLKLSAHEIDRLELGLDQVYSGFAVAGSSAAQTFPVPSLRLVLKSGSSVLLDRGGAARLEGIGEKIALRLGVRLERSAALG